MRLRQISATSDRARPIICALLFLGVVFALGLAAAPQLHHWVHKIGERTNHECAATLMSSGSVEHSTCEPAPAAPTPTPTVPAFRTQLFHGALALLEFTRLEHAPPADH